MVRPSQASGCAPGTSGCIWTVSSTSPAESRTLSSSTVRHHYPHNIEATAAEASPMVRRGYVAAFTE